MRNGIKEKHGQQKNSELLFKSQEEIQKTGWPACISFEEPFYLSGQELGTTNVWKDSVSEFDDIEQGQYHADDIKISILKKKFILLIYSIRIQ